MSATFTAADDDWKGEHLIRRRPTEQDRAKTNRSVISSITSEARRRKGIPAPGAAQHGKFAASVFYNLYKMNDIE